jgi:hypothetical protein
LAMGMIAKNCNNHDAAQQLSFTSNAT